ncbi:MAG: tRNA (adenosine(37)-N6)-threonylcarbamoyltransferase complex dimerization subunit type 1 TsaB [Nitrospirae bacterium]|nr:tRNA (adenosine(37)-N6)-threonylcarbamoyltransferase complex dimerization subunit type 1 TsaB [Nitrospirota bacterium]
MKILALETATMAGSAAIVSDEELIGEIRVNISVAHAERLMPSIEYLLNASRISIKDIDAFAVSIGPGSFTGLRIGLSTAKGFSYSTGRPIISVPTLDAFARTLPFCPHFICPLLDARKNEVYAGLYKWERGICTKIVPETAINPADFLRQIKGPAVFMGEGAKIYRKFIEDVLGDAALFAPAAKMIPSASAVGEIALEKLKEGTIADPVSLAPFYLRKSEAEIKQNEPPSTPDISGRGI